MTSTERVFYIPDIDCETIVEEITRKDFLWLAEEIAENITIGYDCSDYAIEILYTDGSFDYISQDDYDGHKIRKQHIASAILANPQSDMVFGSFNMNECGVVTVAFETKIHESIIER